MKKLIFTFLISIVASLFISCATKTVESEPVVTEEPVVIIPMFDDWEYKGFGNELPVWVEAAYKADMVELAQIYQDKNPGIIKAQGANSDMCENRCNLEAAAKENTEFLDKIWVRVNKDYEDLEEPYIALLIYNQL